LRSRKRNEEKARRRTGNRDNQGEGGTYGQSHLRNLRISLCPSHSEAVSSFQDPSLLHPFSFQKLQAKGSQLGWFPSFFFFFFFALCSLCSWLYFLFSLFFFSLPLDFIGIVRLNEPLDLILSLPFWLPFALLCLCFLRYTTSMHHSAMIKNSCSQLQEANFWNYAQPLKVFSSYSNTLVSEEGNKEKNKSSTT